jgi:hypothetical protein
MTRVSLLLALTLSGAAQMASPAFGSPDDLATIERECGARLKLPSDGCACLRDKASKLKDGQQAFIAAVVTKDKATQASIMENLTVAELTEAGMFMTKAPGQCVKGE